MTQVAAVRCMDAKGAGQFLADLLGRGDRPFSSAYIWRLVRRRQLPAKKLGGRVHFRDVDLIQFIESGGSI